MLPVQLHLHPSLLIWLSPCFHKRLHFSLSWGKCRPYLLFSPVIICVITCVAFLNGNYAAAKAGVCVTAFWKHTVNSLRNRYNWNNNKPCTDCGNYSCKRNKCCPNDSVYILLLQRWFNHCIYRCKQACYCSDYCRRFVCRSVHCYGNLPVTFKEIWFKKFLIINAVWNHNRLANACTAETCTCTKKQHTFNSNPMKLIKTCRIWNSPFTYAAYADCCNDSVYILLLQRWFNHCIYRCSSYLRVGIMEIAMPIAGGIEIRNHIAHE